MELNKYESVSIENIKNLNKLNYKYDLNNLMKLTTNTPINIFNQKKKYIILKDKNILIKECNKIRKKELKELNSMIKLSNLSKLNKSYSDIKPQCNKIENNIIDIENILKYLTIDTESDDENYMEIYQN